MEFFLLGGLALAAFFLFSKSDNKVKNKEITETIEIIKENIFEKFNTYIKNELEPKINSFSWITVGEIVDINNKYQKVFIKTKDKKEKTKEELDFTNSYKKYFTNNGELNKFYP